MPKQKLLRHISPVSRAHLGIFILIFAAIGGVIIWRSLAANPNLPGDLNNDNSVNVTDLSILLSNYGTSNTAADINSDGTVNILDLSALLSNYGKSYTPSGSTDLALNKPTTSDSIQNSSYLSAYSVDGNDSTRWASDTAGRPDWLQVDLGSSSSFGEVDINWEAAYGTNYDIQISNDASAWTNVLSGLNASKAGLIKHTFSTVTARYLRIFVNTSAASDSSIYSLNVFGTGGSQPPPPPPLTGLYFSSNSVWNTLIGSGSVPATLDPNSSSWASLLSTSIGAVNVNQGDYTPTLFTADASTPRYLYKQGDGWITESVPIPTGFKVSPGDGWGTVVDSSTSRIYGFTGQPTITSSTTASGASGFAAIPYSMNGPGTWNDNTGPWGGGASGINYLAGAITPDDVKAGAINHALSMALPKNLNRSEGYAGAPACSGSYVYPASSSDGQGGCTTIPMGTHFQLDPTISDATFQSWGADAGDLMIMHALQKYGVYVRDSTNANSGLISIYAANNILSPGGSTWNYPAGWSNGMPKTLASHFRVLSAPSGVYDSVSTYGQPHK